MLRANKQRDQSNISLTPAALPIPGLGDLDFISSLLSTAPPNAFDNDAMALVLSVMWRENIRKWFVIDVAVFAVYLGCWVALLELSMLSDSTQAKSQNAAAAVLSFVVVALNSLYLMKEFIQSAFGQQISYFKSLWNVFDLLSIIFVYGYVLASFAPTTGQQLMPVAVITTLLLTVKLLSYLRGFSDTGWLISVLIANFRDVRGYVVSFHLWVSSCSSNDMCLTCVLFIAAFLSFFCQFWLDLQSYLGCSLATLLVSITDLSRSVGRFFRHSK